MSPKAKKIDFKHYIIKTKIFKDVIINFFIEFKDMCHNLTIFPTPIYEIFGNENNRDLLELLMTESNLKIKFGELLKEEYNVKKLKLDTTTLLKTIDQNSKLFDFEFPEENADLQTYLSINLKNLLRVKYSLIYYIFNSEVSIIKNLETHLNEENVDDFKNVKNVLVDPNFDCLEGVFGNVYFIEEDVNMKDLIINLKDKSKSKEKINLTLIKAKDPQILHGIDEDISEKDLYLKLIEDQINPRIKILVESLVNIINDNIKFLKKIEETEIKIRESDNSKFYAFYNKIFRYIMSGVWTFTNLLPKKVESKEDKLDEPIEPKNEDSKPESSENDKEISEESTEDEDDEKIIDLIAENYAPINSLISWIEKEEKEIDGKEVGDYTDYIKLKILEFHIRNLKDSLKDWLLSNLEETVENHIYINELLKNAQINIENQEFNKIESLKKKYDTVEITTLSEKFEMELKRIDCIFLDNQFKQWFEERVIEACFITPWISFINIKRYLNKKSNFVLDKNIPFINEMKELSKAGEILKKPSIAQNYLTALYENKYMKSKKITKYKIIFNDLKNLYDMMFEVKRKLLVNINNLFQKTDDLEPEEKSVIELIKNQKQPPNNSQYNDAVEKLIEKGVLQKKQIVTFGND